MHVRSANQRKNNPSSRHHPKEHHLGMRHGSHANHVQKHNINPSRVNSVISAYDNNNNNPLYQNKNPIQFITPPSVFEAPPPNPLPILRVKYLSTPTPLHSEDLIQKMLRVTTSVTFPQQFSHRHNTNSLNHMKSLYKPIYQDVTSSLPPLAPSANVFCNTFHNTIPIYSSEHKTSPLYAMDHHHHHHHHPGVLPYSPAADVAVTHNMQDDAHIARSAASMSQEMSWYEDDETSIPVAATVPPGVDHDKGFHDNHGYSPYMPTINGKLTTTTITPAITITTTTSDPHRSSSKPGTTTTTTATKTTRNQSPSSTPTRSFASSTFRSPEDLEYELHLKKTSKGVKQKSDEFNEKHSTNYSKQKDPNQILHTIEYSGVTNVCKNDHMCDLPTNNDSASTASHIHTRVLPENIDDEVIDNPQVANRLPRDDQVAAQYGIHRSKSVGIKQEPQIGPEVIHHTLSKPLNVQKTQTSSSSSITSNRQNNKHDKRSYSTQNSQTHPTVQQPIKWGGVTRLFHAGQINSVYWDIVEENIHLRLQKQEEEHKKQKQHENEHEREKHHPNTQEKEKQQHNIPDNEEITPEHDDTAVSACTAIPITHISLLRRSLPDWNDPIQHINSQFEEKLSKIHNIVDDTITALRPQRRLGSIVVGEKLRSKMLAASSSSPTSFQVTTNGVRTTPSRSIITYASQEYMNEAQGKRQTGPVPKSHIKLQSQVPRKGVEGSYSGPDYGRSTIKDYEGYSLSELSTNPTRSPNGKKINIPPQTTPKRKILM